jgi:acyl carrier protein
MPPEQNAVPALTEDAILQFLVAHAAEALELPAAETRLITADTRLVDGLALDSLRQVILVTGIEEHFGFQFDLEELAAMGADGTVGDLARLVLRKIAAADTV